MYVMYVATVIRVVTIEQDKKLCLITAQNKFKIIL